MKKNELVADKHGVYWHDRIAQRVDGQFIFRCRKQHAEVSKWFDAKGDAVEFRTRHNHEYHLGDVDAAVAATTRAKTIKTLIEVADELIKEKQQNLEFGKGHIDTIRDMQLHRTRLVAFFTEKQALATMSRERVRGYVLHRLSTSITYNIGKRDGSLGRTVRTGGARVKKEIAFVYRLARRIGVDHQLDWRPESFDELLNSAMVQPKKRRAVPVEKIEEFMQHLEGPARAFVVLKALTALRNQDLFDLKVQDVDLDARTMTHVVHAKREKRRSVAILAPELVPILRRLIIDRKRDDWLFCKRNGKRMGKDAFKEEFKKASKAAGIGVYLFGDPDKPTGGVGWIRHSVITAIRPISSLEAASKLSNHASVIVTEKFYDLDDEARELKRQGVEAARSLFSFSRSGANAKARRGPRRWGAKRTASDGRHR